MKLAWKPLIIAFAVGGIAGFAVARCSAPYAFHRRWGGQHFQERLLQRFNAKLQLTPEQRTNVAAILEAKRQKIDALRTEMRPKFEELRNSTHAEIRRLLAPAQQQKFDVMQAEHDNRMKRFRDRWTETKENGA